MASSIREIVIDCLDPHRVASFWGDVLGWSMRRQQDHWWMSSSGDPAGSDLILVFTPVPDPKRGKNRVHLDLTPTGCDQQEEVERLLRLGARHADVGQRDVPWVVLADPEGNEFCVLARRRD